MRNTDLCLHDVMVWEMFHVLLHLHEILNSAFPIIILIPKQMENPQGNNHVNNMVKCLFMGIHPQEQHFPQPAGPKAEQKEAGG